MSSFEWCCSLRRRLEKRLLRRLLLRYAGSLTNGPPDSVTSVTVDCALRVVEALDDDLRRRAKYEQHA